MNPKEKICTCTNSSKNLKLHSLFSWLTTIDWALENLRENHNQINWSLHLHTVMWVWVFSFSKVLLLWLLKLFNIIWKTNSSRSCLLTSMDMWGGMVVAVKQSRNWGHYDHPGKFLLYIYKLVFSIIRLCSGIQQRPLVLQFINTFNLPG